MTHFTHTSSPLSSSPSDRHQKSVRSFLLFHISIPNQRRPSSSVAGWSPWLGATGGSPVRSYLVGNAGSRPISEAKQPWACLVLGWGTTGEAHVLYSLFYSCPFPPSRVASGSRPEGISKNFFQVSFAEAGPRSAVGRNFSSKFLKWISLRRARYPQGCPTTRTTLFYSSLFSLR